MKTIKTATAIIVRDNKILFFKRDDILTIAEPNKWQLPGGHIENGETPISALKRELIEEVSYAPTNLICIGKIKDSAKEVNVFWGYVGEEEAKKFKLGELEGQAIKFMSVDEALEQELTQNVKFYLAAYKNVLVNHLVSKTIPRIEEFFPH